MRDAQDFQSAFMFGQSGIKFTNVKSFNMEIRVLKLSQLAEISSTIDDADFYLRKTGSENSIGDVVKRLPDGTARSSWFGIKLNDLGRKYIDPTYLYYLMMNLKNQKFWMPKGTLNLVHITKNDVASLKFQLQVEEGDFAIEKESRLKLLKLFKIANGIEPTLFDLNNLKNKRGEIGHQGVDLDDLLGFLNWAEIKINPGSSIKEVLSIPQNKEKLLNKLLERPIDIVRLPDETYWLRDGHHRAKLADLAGFSEIPAYIS